MKVSLIIPSYGQCAFLPETIESALAQTVRSEIIVIDDGSTDGSLKVAREYETFGVKVISQVNKGLASARNTGIMNATGNYILPLDADDLLKENCVERILAFAEKDPEADVIAPSIHCFGVAGEQTTILMDNPTLHDFKVGNRISYCSAIKRSVLLEVGGYSPRMVEGYEDLHLWINLLSRGKKIITIPEPLMLYRVKEDSMIKDAQKHHTKLMDQIYKDFPNFK
jgi:glycosyltransferase involved in cell wall biosynthesis